MRVVLASASPRRLQVLVDAGLDVEVAPTGADEPRKRGSVEDQVLGIAMAKAEAVGEAHPGSIVVVADTMLADPDEPFQAMGKPEDEAGALAMLLRLRGRNHRVWSAAGLRVGGQWGFETASSVVNLAAYDDATLEELLKSGSWKGKAGGYDLHGPMGAHATLIEGDPRTVLGLPAATVDGLLALKSTGWQGE